MGILGQPFYPIFVNFSQFFQARTTFSKSLKNLKQTQIYHTIPLIT